jgi:hypothetical protein
MATAIQNAAKAWRKQIEDKHAKGEISDAEYQKYKARWDRADKIGNMKRYREHIATARINNFKAKYPNVQDAVAFLNNPINRRIVPIGRNAKIIFLRTVYGISKEEAEKFYPKHMKTPKPVRFVYPIEGAEMFNIPEYKPPEEQPPPQPTATTETLTEEKPKKK